MSRVQNAKKQRFYSLITGLTLFAGIVAAQPSTPAQAAVPQPSASTAVITVKVGGVRTSNAAVAPTQGVRLVLLDGSSSTPPPSSASPLSDSWATCTSDAQGDCSFVVPNTGVGGANRDRRFYIEQSGAPTGWYGNPAISTSTDGNSFTATPYAIRTGLQLQAGNAYASTANFMVNGTGVQASSGMWPESMNNPPMPHTCGLDVALVLDLSYSVQLAGAVDTLKQAAEGFTQSLMGTNSQVALFSFGTTAPAIGNTNHGLTPVSTQSGVNTVNNWIENIKISSAEYTNWDRGIYQVAEQQADLPAGQKMYDLVIVLTDGNPTRYGAGTGTTGSPTRFAEVEQAIFSANALKARGTRVVAVGVGDGVTDAQPNLAAISGPIENSDYFTVGWAQAAATLSQFAVNSCTSETSGTVTVLKEVVPQGSTDLAQATPFAGWNIKASSNDSLINGQPSVTEMTAIGTGADTFDVEFPAGLTTTTVTVDEIVSGQPAPLKYYTHLKYPNAADPGDSDNRNAECMLRTPSGTEPLDVTDGAVDAFSITVNAGDLITCIIYNAMDAEPSTIQVDQRWVINGQPYDTGQQPPEFTSHFTLTDDVATYSHLTWGDVYSNLTADSETPETSAVLKQDVFLPPGCTWVNDPSVTAPSSPSGSDATLSGSQLQPVDPETGEPITGDGPYNLAAATSTSGGIYAVTGYSMPVDPAGPNRWLVTNHVQCSVNLTLSNVVTKSVDYQLGTANPQDWTLSATNAGDPNDAATPAYNTAVPDCDDWPLGLVCNTDGSYATSEPISVQPMTPYLLSQTNSNQGAGAYVQNDIRDVTSTSGATASWWCYSVTNSPKEYLGYITPGGEIGALMIPYGVADVECIAVNSTAEAVASVEVTSGTPDLSGWSYSLTPSGPSVDPTAPVVADSPATVANRVRPEQQYTVSDSNPPAGYKLKDIRCTWNELVPDELDMVTHTDESVMSNPVLSVAYDTVASCRFIYEPKATLTLINVVKGGSADPEDWTLSATGPMTISGESGASDVTTVASEPGDYTLDAANGPAGYQSEQWTCVDDHGAIVPVTGTTIVLADDQNVTCTVVQILSSSPSPHVNPGAQTGGSVVDSSPWPLMFAAIMLSLGGLVIWIRRRIGGMILG